jgi:ribosomal protein S18 acetylase RimI-like enzyme
MSKVMRKTIRRKYGHVSYAFESDYVHIYNLYVYPQFRQQGKGEELLTAAIKAIRSTGYRGEIQIVAIPTENSISKTKLRNFYKRHGLGVYTYYG